MGNACLAVFKPLAALSLPPRMSVSTPSSVHTHTRYKKHRNTQILPFLDVRRLSFFSPLHPSSRETLSTAPQSHLRTSSTLEDLVWLEHKKTQAEIICRFADALALLTYIDVMIQKLWWSLAFGRPLGLWLSPESPPLIAERGHFWPCGFHSSFI